MNLFNPLTMRNLASCGGISSGAAFDCDAPLVPGLNPRVWLANYDDIEGYTYDVANTRLVTAITFKTGGAVYVFDGVKQSTNANSELVPQTLSVGFKHMVTLQVFDISSTQKLNLEKMCQGKMVAIIEHPNAVGNGDSVFEILGGGVGMEVTTLTRISRDTESQGSYSLELSTSDNEGQEATLPLSFLDADYATTLAKIEGYETPAP